MIANVHALPVSFFMRLLLLATIAILDVSCVDKTSQEERVQSIVESVPNCRAPCWHGIIPGISSRAEFVSLVDELPASHFTDLEFIENDVWRGYEWEDRANDFFFSLYVQGEQVRSISIQPTTELPLGSVFMSMDTPDSYSAVFFPGERDFVSILLAYPSSGMVVEIFALWYDIEKVGCRFVADESMPVRRIYLTQPNSAAGLIVELREPTPYTQFSASPWPEDGYLNAQECR